MKLPANLTPATFIERLNRFAAMVSLDGAETTVHVANSGRLRELFTSGRRVYLAPRRGEHRRTAYDLILVDMEGTLVSCDARLPNPLTEEAVRNGTLAPLAGYPTIEREVTYGESRLDLRLSGPNGDCYVETKSITLVEDGTALFPDAPTTRGTKHVRSLVKALEEGHRAAVVFVVQREDATRFSPHETADEVFAAALRNAAEHGVEVYAYGCRVDLTDISIARRLPVCL